MGTKCVLCGTAISQGIVCAKCDPPRKREQKPPAPISRDTVAGTVALPAIDPFPKAPVVPFPVEHTSAAATTISEILSAAKVPAVMVSPDGSIRFISEEGKQLPGLGGSLPSVAALEAAIGTRIPDLRRHYSASITIARRIYQFSLIPLSAGSAGAVLIFRPHPSEALHTAYIAYLREAVLTPMRALREALVAAARNRGADPLLEDSASTIDQILTSLEMSPVISDPSDQTAQAARPQKPARPVRPVLQKLADRFAPIADMKGVTVQLDASGADQSFSDVDGLEAAVGTLLENALHYTPADGQIIVGMRSLEHKGKPLLLVFVMDTGPVVPEELREPIFSDSFVWNSNSTQRTARGLSQVRRFASTHSGVAWVESKTGKTCTFFVRLRPE